MADEQGKGKASPKAQDSDATEAPKSGRGKRAEVPKFKDLDGLLSIVQSHRSATEGDNARQFTGGGFKAAGGIDTLPLTTRAVMAGSLIMSLANDAQNNDENAQEILDIVGKFAGTAMTQAAEAKKLSTYNDLCALHGIKPRQDGESINDFATRVLKSVKV